MIVAVDAIEKVHYFLWAQDNGQLLLLLWYRQNVVQDPLSLQGNLVEKTKCRDRDVYRAGRQLLLSGQIDLIGTDLLRTEDCW